MIMRPWILVAKAMGARRKVFADDVLILVGGARMLERFAGTLNATHKFLHKMGARVAPSKSFNFASSKASRDWLHNTWWAEIQAHIDVVKDCRYLGAHLCTQGVRTYRTINQRAKEATEKLRKLKHVAASAEAKGKVIRTKIMPAMLYGIEANDLSERQLSSSTAAIIDLLKDKNNQHDVDLFFATFAHGGDLDLVAQLLVRRTLEFRRCIAKRPEWQEELKRSLELCVAQAEQEGRATEWYRRPGVAEEDQWYPDPATHPTKGDPAQWKAAVAEKGPIGLFVQAVVRAGCQIDNEFNVWQAKEMPVSITCTPYQFLGKLMTDVAVRARTRASRNTKPHNTALGESDAVATKSARKQMEEDEVCAIRVVQSGGGYSKTDIAAINEDVSPECDYCGQGWCDLQHIIWECPLFRGIRKQQDEELADIPLANLSGAIRRGVAPAMRCSTNTTYWGQAIEEGVTQSQCKLLGDDEEAVPDIIKEVIDAAAGANLNCRQLMDRERGPFAKGLQLEFLEGVDEEAPPDINAYGDGSMKIPAEREWSLGAFGVWWPQAVDDDSFRESMPRQQYAFRETYADGIGQWNALNGQCGSSTRIEIAAWLVALTRRTAVHMGSDSQSLITKAALIMRTAQDREEHEERRHWPMPRLIRKPWSLQADGDLWELVWKAITRRGTKAQKLAKVKGHATSEDVAEGRVRACDKAGNDWADDLADRGAVRLGGEAMTFCTRSTVSIALAKWMKKRHRAYRDFMFRVQRLIAKVILAEKVERERRRITAAFITGIDADVEQWVSCKLRDGPVDDKVQGLQLLPPTTGTHRLGGRKQGHYQAVHAFMGDRCWRKVGDEEPIGGITLVELLAMFDTLHYRSSRDRVEEDAGAVERALQRSRRRTKTRRTICIRASLAEELRQFKETVRYIAENDMHGDQHDMFRAEKTAASAETESVRSEGAPTSDKSDCGDAARGNEARRDSHLGAETRHDQAYGDEDNVEEAGGSSGGRR